MLENTSQMRSSKEEVSPRVQYHAQLLSDNQIRIVKAGAWIIAGLIASRYLPGTILAFHGLVAAVRNQRTQ